MPGATVFVTYNTASRVLVGMHLSQAAANADAAADADLTALVGGQTEARDAFGNVVDAMLAEPDGVWSVWTEAPFLRQAPVPRYPIRDAHRAFEDRLDELHEITRSAEITRHHDPLHIQFAQRLIYGSREAQYSVHFDERLNGDDMLRWMQLSSQGPTDAIGGKQIYDRANPGTMADVISTLTPAQFSAAEFRCFSFVSINYAGGAVGTRPMARRTLAQSIAANAWVARRVRGAFVHPTVFDLRGGAWIDDVNA